MTVIIAPKIDQSYLFTRGQLVYILYTHKPQLLPHHTPSFGVMAMPWHENIEKFQRNETAKDHKKRVNVIKLNAKKT